MMMPTTSDENRQPYGSTGDTTGFRTVNWYHEFVYPIMDGVIRAFGTDRCNACLDLGCGNGRHFPYLEARYDSIYGCDPYEHVDARFCNPRTWFTRIGLDRISRSVVAWDGIFIFGSFKAMHGRYRNGFFQQLAKMVGPTNFALSLVEADEWSVAITCGDRLEATHVVTSDKSSCVIAYVERGSGFDIRGVAGK